MQGTGTGSAFLQAATRRHIARPRRVIPARSTPTSRILRSVTGRSSDDTSDWTDVESGSAFEPTELEPPGDPLAPGCMLGDYRIEGKIGEGGMGIVQIGRAHV